MRPKEIQKLIDIVEKSTIYELEVSRFGKKVRISKQPGNATVSSPNNVATVSPSPLAPSNAQPPVISEEALTKQQESASPVPAETSNIIEIKSPMVGTLYRSPSPDADPYVQEGDIVTPNQVLCIIEAMKLMNEIEAEVRGRIVEIIAENGKPVEYDQVLFRIEKL